MVVGETFESESGPWIAYAVYDGHGGRFASEWVGKHLLQNHIAPAVRTKKAHAYKEVADTLVSAFHEADIALHHDKPAHGDAGSTAALLLRCRQHCYLVSVGDSRVIVLDAEGKVLVATEDHRPQDPAEKARVEAAGGRITNDNGEIRVNDDLAMTRAFGDFSLKRKFEHGKPGKFTTTDGVVISTPQVLYFKLDEGKPCQAVVACDGLWDVMSNERVAHALTHEKDIVDGKMEPCTYLRNRALRKGSTDNLSIVIVTLMS